MVPAAADPRVLEPPADLGLSPTAAAFWRTIAAELAPLGWLQFHHLPTFTMYVETWDLYRAAVKATPKTLPKKAFPPAIAIRRQCLEKLMQLGGRFGLDPATSARLANNDDAGGAVAAAAARAAPAQADRGAEWMRDYHAPATGA